MQLTVLTIKFTTLIGIVILVLASYPVVAVEYNLDEDFVDPLNPDWKLYTHDWENGYRNAGVRIQEHNFSLTSGYLISQGDFNPDKFNLATVSHDFAFGAWRITASFPHIQEITSPAETPGLANFFIWISDQPADLGNIGDSYECCGSGLGFGFTNDDVVTFTNWYTHFGISNDLQSFNTSRQYDVIRTSTYVAVFIDSQLIGEKSYSSSTPISSVALGSLHGSMVKFEHFSITLDYEGVCKELGYDCSGNTITTRSDSSSTTQTSLTESNKSTSDTSSSKTKDSPLNSPIFGVSILLLAVISRKKYRRVKK